MRIVSLVPSLSELVCDLGLREQLVGCTSFCVKPKGLHREAEVIGGTKNPDLEAIAALRPTHVLANQEENRREDVDALAAKAAIHCSFPLGPKDIPAMVRTIGNFLDCRPAAARLASNLEEQLEVARAAPRLPRRFYYFIWADPWMVAGIETYISGLLEWFGWQNAIETTRYPTVSLEDRWDREAVYLFASEPWTFRLRDIRRFTDAVGFFPECYKIDGQLLSWYGSSTLEAVRQLEHALRGDGIHAGGILRSVQLE